MKKAKLKFIAFSFLIFILSSLNAQEAIPAAGGDASGGGGSVSYSAGQTFYHTYAGPNGSVAEGVQQPYEISVVTAIEEAMEIKLSVYPNPVSDLLMLDIGNVPDGNFELTELFYELYDLTGKLLRTGKISGDETGISMSDLKSSTYLLKLNQSNREIKVFKIIKN